MDLTTENINFLTNLYWASTISTAIFVLMLVGVQPLKNYRRDGKVNTIIKHIIVAIIIGIYNLIGILGGVVMLAMIIKFIESIVNMAFDIEINLF